MGYEISMAHSIRIIFRDYLVFSFLVILIVGLFLTNYYASFALLLGIFLSQPSKVLYHLFKWRFILLIIMAIFLVALVNQPTPPPPLPIVEEYSVIIEPLYPEMEKFIVNEEIIFYINQEVEDVNSQMIYSRLPKREVTSTNRGLLLKEVHISPLQANSFGYVNLTLPDGFLLRGRLCTYDCPVSRIELYDFPKNSFYDAKDVDGSISYDSYIDKEKISWSASNLNQGIKFAYIPPPAIPVLVVNACMRGINFLMFRKNWAVHIVSP
jgi:hypothetical protein